MAFLFYFENKFVSTRDSSTKTPDINIISKWYFLTEQPERPPLFNGLAPGIADIKLPPPSVR